MYKNEFKYGDTLSSTYDIYCEQETHSILPAMRKYTQEIPGYDGEVDFEIGGYGTRIISLPLYYKGTFKSLRENRENIIAWLAGDGKSKHLILGREPTKYYKAKIYNELNLQNSDDRMIGTIEFECNPPWQYLEDGTVLTPDQITYVNCESESNQFYKTFAENGSIKFVNNGSQSVKPVIKIIGNIKTGIKLTYGTSNMQIDTDIGFDGVEIDCENETVKRISDGSTLYTYVNTDNADFFELATGNCEISLTETGIGVYPDSLTVLVEFEPVMNG